MLLPKVDDTREGNDAIGAHSRLMLPLDVCMTPARAPQLKSCVLQLVVLLLRSKNDRNSGEQFRHVRDMCSLHQHCIHRAGRKAQ